MSDERVAELEAEVARLKEENAALQNTIDAVKRSQERHRGDPEGLAAGLACLL